MNNLDYGDSKIEIVNTDHDFLSGEFPRKGRAKREFVGTAVCFQSLMEKSLEN